MLDELINKAIPIKTKPIIGYWKSGDPCLKINVWQNKLIDINIINTKRLTDEFIEICLKEKHRIFLHINITGMGKTMFEPKIQTVKEIFFQIKKLLSRGFPQKQILIIVNPILPNDNGLNALKLLLKLFTEYKPLRLRFIKFVLLNYRELEDNHNKFVVANFNILKRDSTKMIMPYLVKNASFFKDYYKLIDDYSSIISVDKGDESLIGIRELLPFGYKNEWIDINGNREKLINYENNNKHKPIVNILSGDNPVRCSNRCLLCPWKY
jgi:hypothetical protein